MGDVPNNNVFGKPRRILDYGPPLVPDVLEEIPPSADAPTAQPYSSFLDKADEAVAQLKKTQAGHKGQRVTSNVAYFGDHNRAYYHWNEARLQGKINSDAILIHIDTHDDMQTEWVDDSLPPTKKESELASYNTYANRLGIAAFIAPAVYEGTVSEIYWVLPDWAPKNSEAGKSYWNSEKVSTELWQKLLGSEKDVTFYVAALKGGAVYFSPFPPKEELPIRTVTVHKVYKEELPDFKAEPRSVIVDIDQDWINNTGYDTNDQLTPHSTLEASLDTAKGLVSALRAKNIHPGSVTIAGSPEYTPTDQVDDTTALLVRELSRQGVVQETQWISGRTSFSVNTADLARTLLRFVESNRAHDPRLSGESKSVDDFNHETVSSLFRSLNETEHGAHSADARRAQINFIHNRSLPSLTGETRQELEFARGDYQKFIALCDAYGLIHLKGTVVQLQVLQSNPKTSAKEMSSAYDALLGKLAPMLLRL